MALSLQQILQNRLRLAQTQFMQWYFRVSLIQSRPEQFLGGLNHILLCLCYHEVQPDVPELFSDTPLVVRKENFQRHLEFFSRYFDCIDCDSLQNSMRQSEKPKLLITFDDGYRGVYAHAFPLLREYGFPAIVFLTTDFIEGKSTHWRLALDAWIRSDSERSVRFQLRKEDIAIPMRYPIIKWFKTQAMPDEFRRLETLLRNDRLVSQQLQAFLTWEQVEAMHKQGVRFGLHSSTHAVLASDESRHKHELQSSLERFRQRLQTEPIAYAPPFGREHTFSSSMQEYVGSLLPKKPIFFVDGGLNRFPCLESRVKRICMRDWDISQLSAALRTQLCLYKKHYV